MIAANFSGIPSKTSINAPAFSTACAASISSFAASSLFPCTLNPPNILDDCGVSPMWAHTGICAFTIASICGHTFFPPSNFTAVQPVSFMIRPAFATASYTDV